MSACMCACMRAYVCVCAHICILEESRAVCLLRGSSLQVTISFGDVERFVLQYRSSCPTICHMISASGGQHLKHKGALIFNYIFWHYNQYLLSGHKNKNDTPLSALWIIQKKDFRIMKPGLQYGLEMSLLPFPTAGFPRPCSWVLASSLCSLSVFSLALRVSSPAWCQAWLQLFQSLLEGFSSWLTGGLSEGAPLLPGVSRQSHFPEQKLYTGKKILWDWIYLTLYLEGDLGL